MKSFKFSKFLSVLLAVLLTLFTSTLNVQAGKAGTTTSPTTFSSAETDTTGGIVAITFNKQMSDPTGKQSLFKVYINGIVQTPASAALSSTTSSIINLTISTKVKYGDNVTVSYTSTSSKTALKSTDGVALSSFTNKGVTNNVPPLTPITTETIKYVSLGDSIATGTTGTSTTTSFPYQFRDYLQNKYYPAVNASKNTITNVQFSQRAINGLTTPELINRLTETSADCDTAMVADVKAANIITLSMGGNDLMQWAQIPGFVTVNWASAEVSANDFVIKNWLTLINAIKTLNSSAKLIVTTGYNPYNLEAVSDYESDVAVTSTGYSFSGKTEELVTKMNTAISANAGLGYVIANVYKDFHDNYQTKLMGDVTKFYPYFLGIATPTFRDPHPNQTGQNRIANLFKAFYPVL